MNEETTTSAFYMALDVPADLSPHLARRRKYSEELHNVISVLMDICAILAEAPDIRFVIRGFDTQPWRPTVRSDLSVVLEQLPDVLPSLEAATACDLDFYEQGLQRASLRTGRRRRDHDLYQLGSNLGPAPFHVENVPHGRCRHAPPPLRIVSPSGCDGLSEVGPTPLAFGMGGPGQSAALTISSKPHPPHADERFHASRRYWIGCKKAFSATATSDATGQALGTSQLFPFIVPIGYLPDARMARVKLIDGLEIAFGEDKGGLVQHARTIELAASKFSATDAQREPRAYCGAR